MSHRTIGLAALILIPTISIAPAEDRTQSVDIAQLPSSGPPYRQVAALDANSTNVFRTLVPATEQSGIAQVLNLVGRSALEEQWAFVPAAGLWIEVGHNELASAVDSEVETDVDYLKRIVRLYREVRLYHFHPAGYFAEGLPRGRALLRPDPDSLESIGYALPSPPDIVSSLKLTELLYADQPDIDVSYAVVSPYGVVSYGMTAQGFATIHYEADNPRATTARSIITRLAIRRMAFNIARTIEALAAPTINGVIADLCTQASDENYTMSFTPL